MNRRGNYEAVYPGLSVLSGSHARQVLRIWGITLKGWPHEPRTSAVSERALSAAIPPDDSDTLVPNTDAGE